jgi:FAD/FMN-containing dehydrogenase
MSFQSDVSGRDRVLMNKVIDLFNENQYKRLELIAIKKGIPISISGCQHSMGGQTLSHNGIRVNTTKYYNKVLDLDLNHNTVTVQPGIMWSQLIQFLNNYKKSPTVLQSYCTFSVGGSLSVNAHGVTCDNTLADSIIEFGLISNGKSYICNHKQNQELFAGVIGGYGLLGFVTYIKLKITNNYEVGISDSKMDIDHFVSIYPTILNDDTIKVKYARIDTLDFDKIGMTIHKTTGKIVKSELPSEPRKISHTKQLMFKWVMASRFGKMSRRFYENIYGCGVDSHSSETMSVNDIVFEDANPITHIWEPIIRVNKTHILQEYFIPLKYLKEFVNFVKSILGQDNLLLNLTIRFVKKDTISLLNYAKDNYCALVFYYRINNTKSSENYLETISRALVKKTIDMGGSFYLPYRKHYDLEDIKSCYNIEAFVALKKKIDPTNSYQNIWFNKIYKMHPSTSKVSDTHTYQILPSDPYIKREPKSLESYHNNIFSYSSDEDIINFIKHVFTLPNPSSVISKIRSGGNIYHSMQNDTVSMYPYKQLKLLNQTKKEIGSEFVRLMNKVHKKSETINGVITIGDPGRYYNYIQQFNVTEPKYYMTESQSMTDILERGSIFSPAEYLQLWYDKFEDNYNIPSNTIDLIFVPVGLHHFDNISLTKFMLFVNRVMRPEGRLIVREHDASTENVRNMAHVAHVIFNAYTGVTKDMEDNEIRNFHSINEWESIISDYGFTTDSIYELDKNDPTVDIMFSMQKNGTMNKEYVTSPKSEVYYTLPEWWIVFNTQDQGMWMESTPFYEYPYMKSLTTYWKTVYNTMREDMKINGFFKPLFNSGTLMTVITGSIMTLQFCFISAVSTPIWLLSNLSFVSGRTVCDVTIQSNSVIDMMKLQDDLTDMGCKITHVDNDLIYMETPRYKKQIEIFKYIINNDCLIINVGNLPFMTIMYDSNTNIELDTYKMTEINRFKMHSTNTYYIQYKFPTNNLNKILYYYPNPIHIWD